MATQYTLMPECFVMVELVAIKKVAGTIRHTICDDLTDPKCDVKFLISGLKFVGADFNDFIWHRIVVTKDFKKATIYRCELYDLFYSEVVQGSKYGSAWQRSDDIILPDSIAAGFMEHGLDKSFTL